MPDVKSKNLFEVLGDDQDGSDQEPAAPVKVVEKPVARTSKRNAPDTAPERASGGDRGGKGGRRGAYSGNEGAFRDRDAGSVSNHGKAVDDSRESRPPRGGGRGRGGRSRGGPGQSFHDGRDDRHSRSGQQEHVKQADQGWGANTGRAEWDDEKAGDEMAKTEAKEGFDTNVNPPTDADGNRPEGEPTAPQQEAEPEPEDNSKSYDDYLAEQAEKKLNLGSNLQARKPNEGSKVDKRWAQAKALSKDDAEEEYISAKAGKNARQRERKTKETVDIDHRFVEPGRGERGGRGRGRGEFRGGDRGGRGRGHGGDFRGGRGEARGGRGRDTVNLADPSAFPTLGA